MCFIYKLMSESNVQIILNVHNITHTFLYSSISPALFLHFCMFDGFVYFWIFFLSSLVTPLSTVYFCHSFYCACVYSISNVRVFTAFFSNTHCTQLRYLSLVFCIGIFKPIFCFVSASLWDVLKFFNIYLSLEICKKNWNTKNIKICKKLIFIWHFNR